MNWDAWFTVALVVLGIGWVLRSRRRVSKLEPLTDEEFLRRFDGAFGFHDEAVLRDRDMVAEALGLPKNRLAPAHSFDELKRTADSIEVLVGLTDLERDVDATFRKNHIKQPYVIPDTVGQLLKDLMESRRTRNSGNE